MVALKVWFEHQETGEVAGSRNAVVALKGRLSQPGQLKGVGEAGTP